MIFEFLNLDTLKNEYNIQNIMENNNDIESSREDNSKLSMTATVTGWVMQNPIVFTFLCVCYGGGCVMGISGLMDLVALSNVSTTQLITGLLGGPLLFTIYQAPFNLIKILSDTIDRMRFNNQEYASNNERLNNEISRLKLVETGLQKSLSSMSQILIAGSDKQKELQLALEHIYNDMVKSSDNLSASSSQFMNSLLKMEELTDQLADVTSDNMELSNQLDAVLTDLRNILNDQKQAVFNEHLHELAHNMDRISDGPAGLRQRLTDQALTYEDNKIILEFLSELDEVLKLHNDIEKCHRETKTRMRDRGLLKSENSESSESSEC